jgi:hypothetical protein
MSLDATVVQFKIYKRVLFTLLAAGRGRDDDDDDDDDDAYDDALLAVGRGR